MSILLGIAFPFVLSALAQEGTKLPNNVQYLAIGLQELLLIGFPALLFTHRSQASKERYQALWKKPGSYTVGLVSLAAVAFSLASVMVASLWFILLEGFGVQVPMESSFIKPNNLAEYALAFICAALIPAFSEEIMFRGHILTLLRGRMGDRLACLVGGLVFAVLHFSLQGFASLAVIGMFLSLLVLRYKGILLSIIFHALYNAVVILLNSLSAQPSVQMVMLSTGIFTALYYLLFKKEETRSWN